MKKERKNRPLEIIRGEGQRRYWLQVLTDSIVGPVKCFRPISLAGTVVKEAVAVPGGRVSWSHTEENAPPAAAVDLHLRVTCDPSTNKHIEVHLSRNSSKIKLQQLTVHRKNSFPLNYSVSNKNQQLLRAD